MIKAKDLLKRCDGLLIALMKMEATHSTLRSEIRTLILDLKMLEMEQNASTVKYSVHPMTAMTKEKMAREGVLVSPEKVEGTEGVHSEDR